MTANSRKVFVAMSGGVDSSVAALLLKNEGHEVTGAFMRCYNLDGCSEQDAEDARRVAEHLRIPFYVFDFEDDYKKRVVGYMVSGYKNGITPNPDVMCNKEIKFGLFLEKALSLGADYIATGHYVRKINNSLYAAKDENKDQSYFLWTLTQDQLKHCFFPIGDYTKPEIREIARKAGLSNADKKDSQGICFLGNVRMEDFLKDYIPKSRGSVFTTDGRKVGEHNGAHFYTIGQRHGLDLKDKNKELGVRGSTETEPHYVAVKDISTNTVVVAEGENNPALFRKEIGLTEPNFLSGDKYEGEVLARVRYRQPLSKAVLRGNHLVFQNPQKFVAPGQSAVFYSENGEMLGGGIIA